MNESDPLAPVTLDPGGLPVPVRFAEKAMASLMQLHQELVEEKERRVELYRQLLEKEQAISELAMYVRLLEERLADDEPGAAGEKPARSVPAPQAVRAAPPEGLAPDGAPPGSSAGPVVSRPSPAPAVVAPRAEVNPAPVRVADPALRRPNPADWKVW